MSKTATFHDKDIDKELVKAIIKYQKKKNLPSFIAAVRELCDTGLSIEKIKQK